MPSSAIDSEADLPTLRVPSPAAPHALPREADEPTAKLIAPLQFGKKREVGAGIHDLVGGDVRWLLDMFQAPAESTTTPVAPGKMIGRYRVLARIGEGGFGTVWMAEQTDPVTRLTALKIILPDKASREVITRFEREQQALAMMDHENIATVYDAGTHEGQLYFVMEYVGSLREVADGPQSSGKTEASLAAANQISGSPKPIIIDHQGKTFFATPGEPITSYVRSRALTLRKRIEIFIPVCLAVHHAHQKLVLHRDLKPSNILVAEKDGSAVPKIIDFGIAKALSEEHAMHGAITDGLPVTQMGFVLGTPQYMSPEQARGDADIDAASDTYALGILLYELLVGEPPLSMTEMKQLRGSYDVLERIIHHEPRLPSTLWLQASTLKTFAFDATLGSDPRRISRQMRGDLDSIVQHALEKDRAHRYSSAAALADDLQRYLNDEPVSVGPPSIGYRLRKFYRRHKTVSIAALIVLATIVGGGSLATWQWREALVAKEKETSARQHAQTAQASEASARQRAEASQQLAEASEKAAKQARALAEEQRKKADTARELEAKARSASDLARAEAEDLINFMLYDMRDRLEPLNRTPLLATVADKAEQYFNQQTATLGSTPEQTRNHAAMYQNKGLIELAQGKPDAALASFTAFLKIAAARAANTNSDTAAQHDLALARNRLGMAQQAKGDLPAAQREYQEEQRLVLAILAQHPEASAWQQHLATTHEHLGDISKPSLPHYQAELVLLEKLHQQQPQSIELIRSLATAHEKMATTLRNLSKPTEALPHAEAQLTLLESLPSTLANDVRIRRAKALALQNKGATLIAASRATEALPVLTAAVADSQSIASADPSNQRHQQDLTQAQTSLAICHWELGQAALIQATTSSIKTAKQHFTEGLELLPRSSSPPPDLAALRNRFEQVLAEMAKLLR